MSIVNLKMDDGDLKMFREALCVAESYLLRSEHHSYGARYFSDLIEQVDVHRPLGPNGKHGTRHTATCGCEDK